METLIAVFAISVVIGITYALRHAIAHLIIALGAVATVWYFLVTPGRNGWWSLIGIFVLFGQVLAAKEALFDKPAAKRAELEAARKQEEAENYIFSSGDPEAIKLLMLARANPRNYSQIISGGVKTGNSTLKTAIGVMAGVAIGDVVSDAILESMQNAGLGEGDGRFDAVTSSEHTSDSTEDTEGTGDDTDYA